MARRDRDTRTVTEKRADLIWEEISRHCSKHANIVRPYFTTGRDTLLDITYGPYAPHIRGVLNMKSSCLGHDAYAYLKVPTRHLMKDVKLAVLPVPANIAGSIGSHAIEHLAVQEWLNSDEFGVGVGKLDEVNKAFNAQRSLIESLIRHRRLSMLRMYMDSLPALLRAIGDHNIASTVDKYKLVDGVENFVSPTAAKQLEVLDNMIKVSTICEPPVSFDNDFVGMYAYL